MIILLSVLKLDFFENLSDLHFYNHLKYFCTLIGATNAEKELDRLAREKEQKDEKARLAGIDPQTDLIIPHVELFDMFQRNRLMLFQWLESKPIERNKVLFTVMMSVINIQIYSWV